VTRTPRPDLTDMCEVEMTVGYLVDSIGRPIWSISPWRPIYLRGTRQKKKHPWDFATGTNVTSVIERPHGVQVTLEGGDRLEVVDIDLGHV
jgi:hypothetical protein